MARKKAGPKSVVTLFASDANSSTVEETQISYDEYFEESPKLIDDSGHRASRGIRRITGRIYNSAGELQSEFDNTYDENGKYVHGRAVHQDGTVTER